MVLKRTTRFQRQRRRRTLGPRKRRMPTVKLIATKRRRTVAPGPKKSGIVPDKKISTLRYVLQYNELVGDTISSAGFRANGCFDPEIAIGGHQPRGFDQFMTLYHKYVVLSSTISARASCRSAKESCALSIALVDPARNNNDVTFNDLVENNPRTTRIGHWHPDGGRMGFVRSRVNVAKFLNRRGGIADDLDLQGTAALDPTKQLHYFVNLINSGTAGSDVGLVDLIVTLTYRVMFLQPVKFGQS